MKLIIAAALVAGSAAFLPSGNNAAARGAELGLFKKGKAEPSPLAGEIGVQVPLGFTDPLKLLGDGTDKELFGNYRYVELKHGRVAMLAVTGYLVTKAGVRLPGYEDIPSGLAALKEMPANAWLWTGFTVAILEIMMRDETGESQFPGDFRNGFDFGWDKQTDEWKIKKRTIELNQGRAAQMGILGLMVHESMGNLGSISPFN